MNGSSVISTLRIYLELVGVGVFFLPPFFDYKSATLDHNYRVAARSIDHTSSILSLKYDYGVYLVELGMDLQQN